MPICPNAFFMRSRFIPSAKQVACAATVSAGKTREFALCENLGAFCEARRNLGRCRAAMRVSVPSRHAGPVLCKAAEVPDETQPTESTQLAFPHPPQWLHAWAITLEIVRSWYKDNVSRLAAALSCYALISIAPLGILSVAIAGTVFGQAAARGQVAADMSSLVGVKAARAIETIILNSRGPGSGIWSTVLGVVVLLFGASGVFAELQSAMNTIWKVEPKAGQGVMTFIRHRFFSFAMVLVVALLLFVSLFVGAALPIVAKYFEGTVPGGQLIWQLFNMLVSLILTTFLFALIFKVVPDIDVAWRNVWPGAVLTAVLFTLGKLLLNLYIENSPVTTSYGAAGSLVALVIWVYVSSQIVFCGAEFTEVYSRRIGTGVQPTVHAFLLQRPAEPSNAMSNNTAGLA